MKKLIMLLAIGLPTLAFSQTDTLTGALGLTFNMSLNDAKQSLIGQYGKPMTDNTTFLSWNNQKVFNIQPAAIFLAFDKSKELRSITVTYSSNSDFGDNTNKGNPFANITEYAMFLQFKDALINKYGQPSDSSRSISRLYYGKIKDEDDSQKENSIQQGLEKISCNWVFANGGILLSVQKGRINILYKQISKQKQEKIDIDTNGL